MSLKFRLLLVLILTILFLLVANFAEQYFFILPSFIELEEREAIRNNTRITEAIQNELNHLDMLCGDWAIWDDSYEFVKDSNSEFIESNLELNTLVSAKLNLVLFLDTQNEIVYERFYDLENNFDLVLDKSDYDKLIALGHRDSSESLMKNRGIVPVKAGNLLLSSRPIYTSEGEGPAAGTLVMGRLFTKSVQRKIEEQTEVSFDLLTEFPRKSIHGTEIVERSKDLFTIHGMFSSLQEEISYIIQTTYDREITRRGISSIFLGELLFSLSSVILVLILYTITRRAVVEPLQVIADTTLEISITGNYSKRVPSLGDSEIGKLASVYNSFLHKIEQQTLELQESNTHLNLLARVDGLTGLYNRRTLDETLKAEYFRMKRVQKPLSIILCDIDNFKKYNDHFGHQDGDEVIRSCAEVLKKSIHRASDGAFRYGGEEFCVILADTDIHGAEVVAERIRIGMENLGIDHVPALGHSVVTVSLGFTTGVPSEECSIHELLSQADEALYEAKRLGRNCSAPFDESLRHS